ncbi:DUF397 domain-containing protein [Streptomyces sp. NPDC048411]|uniref:DUF397 domain-containing protein n=1 Tax=Streptomyces sp. NPDC048411 TaxID=3157206 RepID=UPI0034523759
MSTGLSWIKSSYSGNDSGNCVEVALAWSKSSHSSEDSGNCIEVANCPHTVHVRDSKDLTVPALALSPAAWTAFLGYATAQ